MSKVIDVILHKNKYSTQRFLVVDKLPDFKYEEKVIDGQRVLIAKDGIFSSLYYYQRPDAMFQAFENRSFTIPLKDGSSIKAKGQWWHGNSGSNTVSIGIGTPDELAKCNVFHSVDIYKEVYNNIILNRKNPSNNYGKYDKKSANFGKHIIVSKWESHHD